MTSVPQFIDDLIRIGRATDAQIDGIAKALETTDGLVQRQDLRRVLQANFADKRDLQAFERALIGLNPSQVQQILTNIRDWQGESARNSEVLPNDLLDSIVLKLPRLIRSYPAVARTRKAERLQTLTGSTAHAIDILCDARPVFDPNRQQIEGMVPILCLKISFQDQQNGIGSFEVNLSPSMLSALIEQAEKARTKLDILRTSITAWTPYGPLETLD